MIASNSATQAPAGYVEQTCTRHTPPEPGTIYRAWIPTRAKSPREPESQLLIVRVEQISQTRMGPEVILTAADGGNIFSPFKTEAVPLRGGPFSNSWHPVSVFIPVETPPRATK